MSNRLFALLILSVLMSVSCREQNLFETEDVMSGNALPEQGSLLLIDMQGRSLQSLPDKYGCYRLVVREPGEWRLRSSCDFVQLERESGSGCDTIVVMVGRNWSDMREAELILSAEEGPVQRLSVSQLANRSLSVVASKINSSMGAGYSYCPAGRFTMGTGIQVFNMHQLLALQGAYGYNLMNDDYYTTLDTYVCTSDSLSALQSQLNITVSAEVDLKLFTLNFEGEYQNSNVSEGNRTYAAQRMNSTLFSRELNYMNAVALVSEYPEFRDRIFAAGFLLLHDNLVSDINATPDYSTRRNLCRSFVKMVGPCFISKSLMGCNMDYWISVDKSSLDETMDVEALLKFKLESSFSINVDARGSYTANQWKLRNETQSHFECRGGNPQLVSIINASDSLPYAALQEWMLDVEPDNAVLVDMHLEPIYLLFTDSATREALRDYISNMAQ